MTTWHENGKKEREEYWVAGERDRRGSKPAATYWHENGEKACDEYWTAGKRSRWDGEAGGNLLV